jgi:hypothetical protein
MIFLRKIVIFHTKYPKILAPPYARQVGGGVIVCVKNTVNCIIRPDLHVGSLECIWLEIKLNNKKYLYGTYRHGMC